MERVRAATLMAAAALTAGALGGEALQRPAPPSLDIEPDDFGPVHAYGRGKHHGGRPGHNEHAKKKSQRAARKATRRNRK